MEEARNYVILEEVENVSTGEPNSSSTSRGDKTRHNSCVIESKRLLADDEIVYLAQSAWKGKGLFRLVQRDEAPGSNQEASSSSRDMKPKALSRLTRTAKGSIKKLHRISRMSSTKSKESSTERESSPADSQDGDSHPTAHSHHLATQIVTSVKQLTGLGHQAITNSTTSVASPAKRALKVSALTERSTCSVDEHITSTKDKKVAALAKREVQSEGETEASVALPETVAGEGNETDGDEKSAIGSLARLKRLSIKRWKVWR